MMDLKTLNGNILLNASGLLLNAMTGEKYMVMANKEVCFLTL